MAYFVGMTLDVHALRYTQIEDTFDMALRNYYDL